MPQENRFGFCTVILSCLISWLLNQSSSGFEPRTLFSWLWYLYNLPAGNKQICFLYRSSIVFIFRFRKAFTESQTQDIFFSEFWPFSWSHEINIQCLIANWFIHTRAISENKHTHNSDLMR